MMRLVKAEDVKARIDKFLEDFGIIIIGKNIGYYPGLMDCVDDAPSFEEHIPETLHCINIKEAVEKQIPKYIMHSGAAACPTCKKILLYSRFEVPGKYCKWCGQRLEDVKYED